MYGELTRRRGGAEIFSTTEPPRRQERQGFFLTTLNRGGHRGRGGLFWEPSGRGLEPPRHAFEPPRRQERQGLFLTTLNRGGHRGRGGLFWEPSGRGLEPPRHAFEPPRRQERQERQEFFLTTLNRPGRGGLFWEPPGYGFEPPRRQEHQGLFLTTFLALLASWRFTMVPGRLTLSPFIRGSLCVKQIVFIIAVRFIRHRLEPGGYLFIVHQRPQCHPTAARRRRCRRHWDLSSGHKCDPARRR